MFLIFCGDDEKTPWSLMEEALFLSGCQLIFCAHTTDFPLFSAFFPRERKEKERVKGKSAKKDGHGLFSPGSCPPPT